jgi:hypothetical protein
MSDTVVLSVDGLPGLDGAANREAHLVNPDAGHQAPTVSSLALTRVVLFPNAIFFISSDTVKTAGTGSMPQRHFLDSQLVSSQSNCLSRPSELVA